MLKNQEGTNNLKVFESNNGGEKIRGREFGQGVFWGREDDENSRVF